jgi:uncharacterized RDD family membrane protein YckC
MSTDAFEIICNRCRAAVPSDAEICPECGNVLISRPDRAPPPPATLTEAPAAAPVAAPPAEPVGRLEFPAITYPPDLDRSRRMSASSYPGFWIRFVAYMIDSALILIAFFVAYAVIARAAGYVVYFAALLLYFPLMEASAHQGTLGKIFCGIAVSDTDGRRISVGRAYGRFFGKFVSSLTFGIGYLMVAFTARKQALHDMIAGTLVLRRGLY